MCEARQQRGLVIAAKCRIKQNGNDAWLVPSQSTPGGRYSVYRDGEGFRYTCSDHEIGGCQCKHIIAVKITIEREENEDGSVKGNHHDDAHRQAQDLPSKLASLQRRADK
jgi:hypothetical protein